MKGFNYEKNAVLRILVLILTLTTTFFSLKAYDDHLMSNLHSYDVMPNDEESGYYFLNINRKIPLNEREKFYNDLLYLIDENDLNIYQINSDSEGNDYIFARTKDQAYLKRIVLEKGEVEAGNDMFYSTNSKDKENKIFTIFPHSITILSHQFDHSAFSLVGFHTVTGEEHVEEKLENFN